MGVLKAASPNLDEVNIWRLVEHGGGVCPSEARKGEDGEALKEIEVCHSWGWHGFATTVTSWEAGGKHRYPSVTNHVGKGQRMLLELRKRVEFDI